jgi:type III secretion protein T
LNTYYFSFEFLSFGEAVIINAVRPMAAFAILPFMSTQSIDNPLVRNSFILALCLPLLPNAYVLLEQAKDVDSLMMALYLAKEGVIGLLLGFLVAIPFWILEGMGDLLDNQRGASNAEQMDVQIGSNASPSAALFSKIFLTLYFSVGGFFIFVSTLYKSYDIWPVYSTLPEMTLPTAIQVLKLLDVLMRSVILFVSPMVISMFFVEFGLAIINRFAQQLNVFVLAMPLKSITGLFVMYFYLPIMMPYLIKEINNQNSLIQQLQVFIQ